MAGTPGEPPPGRIEPSIWMTLRRGRGPAAPYYARRWRLPPRQSLRRLSRTGASRRGHPPACSGLRRIPKKLIQNKLVDTQSAPSERGAERSLRESGTHVAERPDACSAWRKPGSGRAVCKKIVQTQGLSECPSAVVATDSRASSVTTASARPRVSPSSATAYRMRPIAVSPTSTADPGAGAAAADSKR